MVNETMQCNAARELMPLYLSGELDASQRTTFDEHLARCAGCRSRADVERRVDAGLRDAVLAEAVASGPILSRFRNESYGKRIGLWGRLAIAAALLATIAAGFTYWQLKAPKATNIYTAALRDHHRELVEKQPRRWISELAGVERLAAEQGVAAQLLGQLAPAGYRLEHGKLCRLNGKPFLHLVYENRGEEVSLFLSRGDVEARKLYATELGGDHLASVQSGGLSVVYVTDQAAEAGRLAAQAAEVL